MGTDLGEDQDLRDWRADELVGHRLEIAGVSEVVWREVQHQKRHSSPSCTHANASSPIELLPTSQLLTKMALTAIL